MNDETDSSNCSSPQKKWESGPNLQRLSHNIGTILPLAKMAAPSENVSSVAYGRLRVIFPLCFPLFPMSHWKSLGKEIQQLKLHIPAHADSQLPCQSPRKFIIASFHQRLQLGFPKTLAKWIIKASSWQKLRQIAWKRCYNYLETQSQPFAVFTNLTRLVNKKLRVLLLLKNIIWPFV